MEDPKDPKEQPEETPAGVPPTDVPADDTGVPGGPSLTPPPAGGDDAAAGGEEAPAQEPWKPAQ